MQQNATEFEWTGTKERSAVLLAQGDVSDEGIASLLKINRTTLWRWKEHPEFDARVRQNVEQMRLAALTEGIADRSNRLRALNDRWQRMNAVIHARAQNPEIKKLPGGDTGLVVKQVKAIGKGDDFQIIELSAVDTGLLREMLAAEQQAAKELGQWTEKSKVEVSDGGIIDALQSKFAEIFGREEGEVPGEPDDRGGDGS